MIIAKQEFFGTFNSESYAFQYNKATILYLTSAYHSLSVLSAKLYFLKSVQYIKSYGHLNIFKFSRVESHLKELPTYSNM